MALVVETSTIYESSAAANIHTYNAPASIAEGELLVTVAITRAAAPAGRAFDTDWTERVFLADADGPNSEYIAVGTKRATASEPATYDYKINTSASRDATIFCLRISGDDDAQANPVHVSATTDQSGGDTSHVCPEVTTTVDNTLIFYALGDSLTGGYTEDSGTPAGTTLIGLRLSGTQCWGGLVYKALASAGASGTGTYTSGATSSEAVMATFAIAPAVVAGRIMSSLAGAGGLAGPGGLAGAGGGLAG